jgi:hypothetical protein
MRTQLFLLKWTMVALLTALIPALMAEETIPLHTVNNSAVKEVETGSRQMASAAWWGFNPEDSTQTLQAALNSKAKTLVIPYMGSPWLVRPLRLHSDQLILLEPGVLVLAKKGEFKGKGDSLFTASDVENLTLRGYGATLRMRKEDYQKAPYEKAEWRMGIAIRGGKNVLIEGLRIESSGGDGIYFDSGSIRRWSENCTVRNVTCYNNHRQGISVISAKNLLVEGCSLSGTSGTPPESGIDLEPDAPDQVLENCIIRNCLFENNAGNAAAVYLKQQSSASRPVSILFENCMARMGRAGDPAEVVENIQPGGWGGFAIGAIRDDGPQGLIELRNCVSENTGREGLRIYDNSSKGVKIRLENCSWRNPWLSDPLDYDGPRSPISIILRRPELTTKFGGVEFVDCHVYDTVNRPALVAHELKSAFGVRDLIGSITVHNPYGARAELGEHPQNVSPDIVKQAKER